MNTRNRTKTDIENIVHKTGFIINLCPHLSQCSENVDKDNPKGED